MLSRTGAFGFGRRTATRPGSPRCRPSGVGCAATGGRAGEGLPGCSARLVVSALRLGGRPGRVAAVVTAADVLVAVLVAWVFATTLLVFLYAAGYRFDD